MTIAAANADTTGPGTTGPGTDHLTTAEAGAQLGVQAQRIRQYIYQGRLPGAARRGRDWMIPPKSL